MLCRSNPETFSVAENYDAVKLGPPPKVIWLRCGNQATGFVETLIRSHAEAISSFGLEAPTACLEIY